MAEKKRKAGDRMIVTRLPPELKTRLVQLAERKGVQQKAIIVPAVERYVSMLEKRGE